MPSPAAPAAELIALQSALAGRYTIDRELGRGGMGVVYLAHDLVLERQVAIKLLPPHLAARPELRDRFLRETRTAAGLSHPNIVPIFSVEEREGLVFFVMGLIDGETLTERVQRTGPLPPADAARVLQEAGWALSYAHGRGIIHRDVKADNVLIERATGRAFITDFGIARIADSTMTAVGESLGTPQYMSPEQATGEAVDQRSDLYSLGIVGFFALTARLPFEASSMQAILAMQVTKPAPPVASVRPGLPKRLAESIDRALLKDPAERWPSAEAFVAAIQSAQGAAGPEVAPQVRNFQRVTEAMLVQLITLFTILPALQVSKPREPAILMVWIIVVPLVIVVQVVMRARMLLQQGFGYEDLRTALQFELRQRQEELDALLGEARHRRAWPAMVSIATGGGLIGGGIAVASGTHLHTVQGTIAVTMIGLGIALAIGTILFRSGALASMERRGGKLAARIWLGPVGRGIFWLAGRGVRASTPRARAAEKERSVGLATISDQLPAPLRKQLREVRSLSPKLDAALRALQDRERELERTLAEAGALSPAGAVTAGEGGASATGALERRDAVAGELVAAREQAVELRGALAAAKDALRLQLLRLRSGLGSVSEMEPDLASARALLARAEGMTHR